MSDNVIIIRFSEIYLKGKNRGFFENLLMENIKKSLKNIDCKTTFGRSRYEVSDYGDEAVVIDRLKKVFGIHSVSVARKCFADLDAICEVVCKMDLKGSFKISTHRADKSFPYTSIEVSSMVGGRVLECKPQLSVDVHDPDTEIFIDIREDGSAYIFKDKIMCSGGMPVGSSGKGLLMLSGGLDSPVAGYMMAKRGMRLEAIHFHSYPYTSEKAKQKVINLAQILKDYTGPIRLNCIPFTKIQEEIHKNCDSSYMITLVRRFMMRIAERIAHMDHCSCLINGESLGQVASQTIESITVTNDIVKSMPIFRPCIGMDKQEIIETALKIKTYDTSVLPYEDCCTVFLPDHPITKPRLFVARKEEDKIPAFEELIAEAIDNREIINIE